MEAVTQDLFDDWKFHPVTKKLLRLLEEEREEMKEGLVNSIYEHEEEVKGRCRTIGLMLSLKYEDLYPPVERKTENDDDDQ